MYILDTNTVRAILRNPTPYLQQRITSTRYELLYISVVVAHEMLKGVLEGLSKNERTRDATRHYEFLRNVIGDVNRFQILPYDDEAERIFQAFPPATKRIGTKDCRIAASALSRGFIVVTRNLEDFRLTGVRCENWIDLPTYTQ